MDSFFHPRLLFLALLLAAGGASADGDAMRGKALYQARCTSCHSIEYNGVGPAHAGVFGRKAGLAPGYAYSPALQNAAIVWNERNLARWLANPERLVPGQKMGVSVASAKERADLIAFLKLQAH